MNFSLLLAQEKTLTLGGKLELAPDTSAVSEPITSILWKHGDNMVAEWFQGTPIDYYEQFKGRTDLDISTGCLVINGLSIRDTGVYSVEFNNILQGEKYPIVISKYEGCPAKPILNVYS